MLRDEHSVELMPARLLWWRGTALEYFTGNALKLLGIFTGIGGGTVVGFHFDDWGIPLRWMWYSLAVMDSTGIDLSSEGMEVGFH